MKRHPKSGTFRHDGDRGRVISVSHRPAVRMGLQNEADGRATHERAPHLCQVSSLASARADGGGNALEYRQPNCSIELIFYPEVETLRLPRTCVRGEK